MVAVERGTLQNVLYNVHKTTGLTILILAVIRLGWRWANPVPALPADLPRWQAGIARLTHALLYVVLFLMPISGFLYTTLSGFPVPFFGLYDLARLVPENKPAAALFKTVHLTLQWLLYAVVLLHAAGALQHHFVRKDGVLRRMLSPTAPLPDLRR
jgi:cytochrome b561